MFKWITKLFKSEEDEQRQLNSRILKFYYSNIYGGKFYRVNHISIPCNLKLLTNGLGSIDVKGKSRDVTLMLSVEQFLGWVYDN